MKVALLVLLAIVAVTHATNWHGSWSAVNRYGGVMYLCPKGERLYGVYSNGGFLIGRIDGNVVTGNWWEGGRGDRNIYQGSFSWRLSEDGQRFDGFYNRISTDGEPVRWHEQRLGSPEPANPSDVQCLVPRRVRLEGTYTGGPVGDASPGEYKMCVRQETGQVYGSFSSPAGFFEGWTVEDNTGFHGWRYDSEGRSGAAILRVVGETEVRGFFWKGRLTRGNIGTAREEILSRTSLVAKKRDCQQVGPGFLNRLHGPSSASTMSVGLLTVALTAVFAIAFAL